MNLFAVCRITQKGQRGKRNDVGRQTRASLCSRYRADHKVADLSQLSKKYIRVNNDSTLFTFIW